MPTSNAARERYDVVVVGGRPAGAATALLLARAGLRVLVVDRSRYGADTLSTHALLRGAVVQLVRWGLIDQVVAAGTPPVRHSIFHYGDDRIDVPIKPGAGIDALYAPRRTVLDPILVDAAIEAGAEFRFGVTVTGLRHDHTGRVTGVVGHDEANRRFTAEASVTVGADGIGSTVARLTAAPVERAGTAATAFIYGYWNGLPVDGYHLYYRPGVTGGAFPTNGDQTCVFIGTSPRRFRSEGRGRVAQLYRALSDEVAPDLVEAAGAHAPQRLRVFTGRPGHLRQAHGPGWALVGDAGYFKDPATAHGITDALRDAELLARAIIACATGDAQEAAALADYQAVRDRLSYRLFTITDTIASLDWTLEQIPALLIELSESMNDEVDWLSGLDAVGASAAA
jgi:flavin-dependent dehydrogenase